jgi:hypothetical protein
VTNKEFDEKYGPWIDAIRNKMSVMVSDNGDDWNGPFTAKAFQTDSVYTYGTKDCWWVYWKPAKKKVFKAKGAVEIMQILVEKGYEPNKYGSWDLDGYAGITFFGSMWAECGKDLSNTTYNWEPEWTEEVKE